MKTKYHLGHIFWWIWVTLMLIINIPITIIFAFFKWLFSKDNYKECYNKILKYRMDAFTFKAENTEE